LRFRKITHFLISKTQKYDFLENTASPANLGSHVPSGNRKASTEHKLSFDPNFISVGGFCAENEAFYVCSFQHALKSMF